MFVEYHKGTTIVQCWTCVVIPRRDREGNSKIMLPRIVDSVIVVVADGKYVVVEGNTFELE